MTATQELIRDLKLWACSPRVPTNAQLVMLEAIGRLSAPTEVRRIDLRQLYSESRLALFGMFDDCDEERWQILREMERRLLLPSPQREKP